MMNRVILILVLFALVNSPAIAEEFRTIKVFIVRHAEKSDHGKDPELSEKGKQRAIELSELLSKVKITHLYSSDFKRTRNTLAPLAVANNLQIKTLPAADFNLWKKTIMSHPGKTIVIAGHSNTVDDICEVLGAPAFEDLKDHVYDNVFLLVIYAPERTEFINLVLN